MSDSKTDQPEQTQWEVIDSAGPQQRQQQQPRPGRAAAMRAMLGPWWRWKIAGVTVVLCAIVALVFAMAGVLFVIGVVIVLASLVIAKVRQWLRQGGSALTR